MADLSIFDQHLQNIYAKLGIGNQGGGDFVGASNMQSPSDRYTEQAGRGGAPFTMGGIAAALGNAAGVTDPMTMGLGTAASNLTGMNLGGIQNIPGHFAIFHGPPGSRITLGDYQKEYAKGSRSAKAKASNAAIGRGMGMSLGHPGGRGYSGGGIGSGNAVGGPGYGTAR